MVRCLRVMTSLFAGIMTALACVVLGVLASLATSDTRPQAERDPTPGFDLAIASPAETTTAPTVRHPMGRGLEQAALFAVIGSYSLPERNRRAAPAAGAISDPTAGGAAREPGPGPAFGLPEQGPDQSFGSDDARRSPTLPHRGKIPKALPVAPAEPSAALPTMPRDARDAASPGPEHFLQAGFFAYRENAAGLFEKLANAGLSVMLERTANRFGETRWRVLVGPYRHTQDALRARNAAPELLAEAFHTTDVQ